MQMNTLGEEGSHSQLQPEPFTLGKGKVWDGEGGRGKEKTGNGKRRGRWRVEKLMAGSFYHEGIFPVSTGWLCLSRTSTMSQQCSKHNQYTFLFTSKHAALYL